MEEKNITESAIKDPNVSIITKISKIKKRITTVIENIDQSTSEINNEKDQTIEKIETKKKEIRELTEEEKSKDNEETRKEIKITGKKIKKTKMPIALLDDTMARLDSQITQIHTEHDKAICELEVKRRRLNQQLESYDDLNKKLLNLFQVETKNHEDKLNILLRERSEILQRTDLSKTDLKKMLYDIDDKIDQLSKEHSLVIDKTN